MKNSKDLTYQEFCNIRKNILSSHNDDHVFFQTNSSILISAPHGVSQVRLGKFKQAERGTIPLAFEVAKRTNANLIIKTRNDDDDANFFEHSLYRQKLNEIIETQKIRYLIDFHGLAKSRPCDINLGINFGQNISLNTRLFDSLVRSLESNGFSVFIDIPFAAGPKTIAGSSAKKFNIWTIQIEVNSKLTNEPANIEKCNRLINTIVDWINRNY